LLFLPLKNGFKPTSGTWVMALYEIRTLITRDRTSLIAFGDFEVDLTAILAAHQLLRRRETVEGCEAATRPSMRFVEIKTCEQHGTLVLHRVRLMLMRQRVQLSNAIRGHMAEDGLVAEVGRNGLQRLIAILGNLDDERVPAVARTSLTPLVCQFGLVNDQVLDNDQQVKASARAAELGCRLMEVPGVGPVLASAIAATVLDPHRLQVGQRSGCLDRACTAAELQRRQGEAGRQGDRYLCASW
jgi:transposase